MSDSPVYLRGHGRGRGSNPSPTQPVSPVAGRGHSQRQVGSPTRFANSPRQQMDSSKRLVDSPRGWAGWAKDDNSVANVNGATGTDTASPTPEEKFQAASTKNQDSIKRHMEDKMGDNSDNDEEEEDDIGDSVLQKIFQTYSTDNTDANIGDAQDTLLHQFRSGTSACLVCIDTIKKNDPIWSCEGCSAIFHIQCIQKWVREGVYQQMYQSDDDDIKPEDVPWHCPKCRLEYSQQQQPSRYLCFCGKVEDPVFDPWLVPHSCGQTCGRPLRLDCGHSCLLLCHPGSCPPCPKMVRVACYCGNSGTQMRRCSARTWACGGRCRRPLACAQHTCVNACHPGDCAPCPKTSTQFCQCGRSQSVRPCASPVWQCDRLCGRSLSCGNHICEKVCHTGDCGSCPRGGLRSCPCGKTEYDLPCTEDISTCGDTCGKLLECGLHKCVQRCHIGPCGQCRQMALKKCRCQSQKEKEVPCYKEFLCESKCTKLRDCQKHPCKRKCCDGDCPSCEQTCNKLLSCKNHKCACRCHRGRCYPCVETVTITCSCKATKVTVPCGREKVTKPPRCSHKCKTAPDCHHPTRVPHRCHFGPCPPCRQPCKKQLPNCVHVCPALCHAAVTVRHQDKTPRAGPWEGGPRIIEDVVNKPCPPCAVPEPVQCLGKHEISQFPCAKVRPYKCGRPCGRELNCGNHTCSLDCHSLQGVTDPRKSSSNCGQCELTCQFDRPEGCTHSCPQACHPGPCPPCQQMFRMRCHCQTTVQHIVCHRWAGAQGDARDKLKSCGGPCPKLLPCNHPCGAPCHAGACIRPDQCERRTTVRCPCKRKKRETRCRDRQRDTAALECDEVCKKEQKKKQEVEEEQERLRRAEEEKKQRAELEEFERKMKGRKRKQRKQRENIVEKSFIQKHRVALIIGLLLVFVAIFLACVWDTTGGSSVPGDGNAKNDATNS